MASWFPSGGGRGGGEPGPSDPAGPAGPAGGPLLQRAGSGPIRFPGIARRVGGGGGPLASPSGRPLPPRPPPPTAWVTRGPGSPTTTAGGGGSHAGELEGGAKARQRAKVTRLLDAPTVDLAQLRQACWGGVPPDLRPLCWQMLLGQLPPDSTKWSHLSGAKRRRYRELMVRYDAAMANQGTPEEIALAHQISIDVPRTATDLPLFSQGPVRHSLARILYLRAIHHPASGYVQGFNDIVTPFLATFLSRLMTGPMKAWNISSVPADRLVEAESDCFWCFCRFLETIEDYYIREQPGIRRCIAHLESLVGRIDAELHAHLREHDVDYLHFAFRWLNCLLVRELPFPLVLRLWDTYMAEAHKFESFLVFMCVALLLRFKDHLLTLDTQGLILFLQKLPTGDWDEAEVELLLSTAFMWQSVFSETLQVGSTGQQISPLAGAHSGGSYIS